VDSLLKVGTEAAVVNDDRVYLQHIRDAPADIARNCSYEGSIQLDISNQNDLSRR
jgi:hypothetical protein